MARDDRQIADLWAICFPDGDFSFVCDEQKEHCINCGFPSFAQSIWELHDGKGDVFKHPPSAITAAFTSLLQEYAFIVRSFYKAIGDGSGTINDVALQSLDGDQIIDLRTACEDELIFASHTMSKQVAHACTVIWQKRHLNLVLSSREQANS
jgi:hypothetical protein